MKTLISQGAEAKLYKFKIDNKTYISKERIPKSYRIRILDDKIRKYRTRRELDLLKRASNITNVPKLHPASSERDFTIIMEFIEGKKLADCLDSLSVKERQNVYFEIGKNLALLHNNNIIHGDMTTSNMILNKELYFIDFGLGFLDHREEHKAVDLHLLKQALESRHYKHFEESFNKVLEGYKQFSKDFDKIMERFSKVEKRGRYKNK